MMMRVVGPGKGWDWLVRVANLGSECVGEVHGQWLTQAPTAV